MGRLVSKSEAFTGSSGHILPVIKKPYLNHGLNCLKQLLTNVDFFWMELDCLAKVWDIFMHMSILSCSPKKKYINLVSVVY